MKDTFQVYILLLILLFSCPINLQAENGSDLFYVIEKGDLVGVKSYFKSHDVNGLYGDKELTPLTFAIQKNQYKVVKLLVKLGADVNQLCSNKTPLIYTIDGSKLKIAKYLLKKGASVNDTTPIGNTAMIYTGVQGELAMAQFLVKNKADFNKTNKAGKTALDYANEFFNRTVGDYLRSLHAKSKATDYPNFSDGPHIIWTSDDDAIQFYMRRDSATDKTITDTKPLRIVKSPFQFNGFGSDTSTYYLYKEKKQPPAIYRDVPKILAIGDVHGGYDSLIHFLKIQGVINDQLNWSWGNGHLIFMGDIFDRGEKVTECLWLIYKLENQAPKQGGMAHLILGNHELLVMGKSIDDISYKYAYMTNYLNISYSDFFAEDTEFGRWLRTRNIAIKIDDKLFVHGGISPAFLDMDIGFEEMNQLINKFLTKRVDTLGIEKTKFLLGELGPFWYRGYLFRSDSYQKIDEDQLDRILDFFDVSTVIVGHTNVRNIQGLFNKKVLATDIPFWMPKNTFKALLIEGDKLFILDSDGSVSRLE